MHNKKVNIIFKLLLLLSGAAFLVITTPRNKTSVIVHCAAIFLLLIAVILLPIKYETPGKKKKFVFLAGIVIGIYVCSKISWKFYMAWKPANTFILIAQNLGVSHKLLLKGFSIATAAAAIPFLAYALTCAVCKTIAMSSEKRLKMFSWAFLLGTCIATICVLNLKIDDLTNSDMSSEMVLAKMLADENRIMTPNWLYGNEIHFINMQIIFAFLFKFLSDWHLIRILSTAIVYIFMVASCYYCCKCLGCKKYGIIVSAILLMPFSEQYRNFMLVNCFYVVFVCTSFVTIGLIEEYIRQNDKTKRIVVLVFAVILAVTAGMGGPRPLIVLYMPLLISVVVICGMELYSAKKLSEPNRKYMFSVLVCSASAGIGYIINSRFFSKIYYFVNQNNLSYTSDAFNIITLQEVVSGFLNSYGWTGGKVFSFATINNAVCILLIVCTVYSIVLGIKEKNEKPEYCRTAVFALSAVVVFVLLYLITSMAYADRYNLPIIVITAPLLALLFDDMKFKESIREVFPYIVVFAILISSTSQYKAMLQTPESERKVVSDVLVNQGYYSGYATFWNANVLTELSDGKIEVWSFTPGNSLSEVESHQYINELAWLYLQKKSHAKTAPEGKVFVLLSSEQYDACNWKSYLKEKDIIYKSDKYYIYGYEDYYHIPEEMRSH